MTSPEPGPGGGDEAVPAPPTSTTSDGPRRSSFRLAVAGAVVFAVLSVFLAVVTVSLSGDLEAERSGDREDVARAAGAFSEALLTYRFDELEAARDRVLALATGRFAREYEEAFSGLSELIERTEARGSATVTEVFVGEVDGGRAEAITVVDASVEGSAGPRDLPDSYIRLDLVKVDGEWKVDGVTSLNFTQAGAPGPGSDPSAPTD